MEASMDIKKILWASDGSKESEYALKYVELLTSKYNSEIIGLSIIQPLNISKLKVPPEVKKELSMIQARLEKKQYERINTALAQLRLKETKWDIRIETGIPHEEILRVAEEEKADLIVMGKRGLGLINRMLIGSTTLKVLRQSSVPVLAVRDGHHGESSVEIRKILVPIDISEKVGSALIHAIDLAQKMNAGISVLYIFRFDTYPYEIPSSVATEDIMTVLEYLMKISHNELSKRVEEIKLKYGIQSNLEINTGVVYGINTAVSIVDYASSKNIDLIVINTHGRKGVKRFILGSVTEKVIQEAPCPVLVLKP
jgi:nucleotide-binding universal stress UspA family protein